MNTAKAEMAVGREDVRGLVDANELAALLKVPVSWVYLNYGELPLIKVGRYVRYDFNEVVNWLRRQQEI